MMLNDLKFTHINAESEDLYDPQHEFNKMGAEKSYPLFIEMLAEIIECCIKWAQLIIKGHWGRAVAQI